MDDIWIISWFNHTAFDANPIWKSPTLTISSKEACTLGEFGESIDKAGTCKQFVQTSNYR